MRRRSCISLPFFRGNAGVSRMFLSQLNVCTPFYAVIRAKTDKEISISTSFKRVEAMTHTPYIEDCCTALEQHNEFSTDTCLVKLVRTQVVVRKLAQSLPSDDLEPLWNSMTPIGMVVKALEAEMEKLLTPNMQANSTTTRSYCLVIRLMDF
jgi:hypothetical protein